MKSLRYLVSALILAAASCRNPAALVEVPRKNPALPQGAVLSFAKAEVTGLAGKTFTMEVTKTGGADDKGTISYSSSDLAVAAVDEGTGQVTTLKVGTTTITATKKATARYAGSKAGYTFVVVKPGTATGVELSYAKATVSVEDGHAPFTQKLTRTDVRDDDGAVTYASSHPAAATVDEGTGQVTIVKGGRTTITATKAATVRYRESTASYAFVVVKPGVELSYARDSVDLGDVAAGSKHTEALTESVEAGHTELITFALSEVKDGAAPVSGAQADAVVTVDAGTGELTIKRAGEAKVTATKPAGGGFKESTAGYVITFGIISP